MIDIGYDMDWVCVPPETAATIKAARSYYDAAALLARNIDAEELRVKAHETWLKADVAYFRLNIAGMSLARQALHAVGVVYASDPPHWPQAAEFGLEDYPDEVPRWDFAENRWVDDDQQSIVVKPGPLLAYATASRDLLCEVPSGDTHGIASHKFGSNDGWVVTPGEIITGIGWADHHHHLWRDGLQEVIARFVVWMELAAKVGRGFRVY